MATHSPSYYQYRSCTNILGSKSCIPAQLFCDRVINCAFEEKFGSDEYIANCLPVLLKLLLPRARQQIFSTTTWRPTTLSSATNPVTLTTTLPPIVTSVSTTPSTTTTTSTTTTAPSTTSVTTTIATTTPPSTTTTTTTSTTTTPEPALQSGIELSSTTAIPSSVPFTIQLQNHLFDISPPVITVTHRTTPPTPTPTTTTTSTTTLAPTPAVEFTSTEFHTVRLPPEFEETVNYHDISIGNNLTLLSQQTPEVLEPNMTFTGIDNTLSVEEDQGQVEQLNADIDVNEAEHQNKDTLLISPGLFEEDANGSTTLWIIFVILVMLAVICILRLYCCRNRVIWIPNPKMLRAQRKRREMSINNQARNYPDVHRSSTLKTSSLGRSTETTPPSYDILFPKKRLHDADVLP